MKKNLLKITSVILIVLLCLNYSFSQIKVDDGNRVSVGSLAPSTTFQFQTSGTSYFDGNVGIGAASPAYKLDILGDLRVSNRTGTPQFGAAFDVNGKLITTGLSIVGGSGTTDYLAIWTGTNSLGSSFLKRNAAGYLQVENTSTNGKFDILSSTGNIFFNGGNTTATGQNNIGIGTNALNANTTGVWNLAIGVNSLINNTTGAANVAFGIGAGFMNTSGNYNVAFGANSLNKNSIGGYNVAIGSEALYENLTDNNIAIGNSCLRSNTVGAYNNGLGTYSLNSNTTGLFNNAFGMYALQSNVTGSGNIALGFEALKNDVLVNNTIAIGHRSGLNSNADGSVYIGPESGYNNTQDNSLFISNSQTATPLVHGRFDLNELTINGKLKYTTQSSSNASALTGVGTDGFFKQVTLGSNLNLSGSTLNATEVDGSLTNEGLLTVSGTTTQTITSNTAGSTPVNISGAGIVSMSGVGNNITITGTELDGLTTNEGSLTVGAGAANTSLINSNTSGSTPVTVTAGTGLSIAEVGNTITLTNTGVLAEVDGLITNEGSLTVGVGAANTSLINSNTSTSTPVTITAGTGLSIAETGNIITLTNTGLVTEVDGSVTNEGALTVSGTTTKTIASNTFGSTNVTLTGAGIATLGGTGNAITITATEVDGSTTNEIELPIQTGNAGRYLKTDGTIASWAVAPVLPTGTIGQTLYHDGNAFAATSALTISNGNNRVFINNYTGTVNLSSKLLVNGGVQNSSLGTPAIAVKGRDVDGGDTNMSLGSGFGITAGTINFTEVDGLPTNEGALTVSGTTTKTIASNTSGSSPVTLTGAGIVALSGTGNAITVTGTEVDGSLTNEGALTVSGTTTKTITSNTSGSSPVTFTGAGIVALSGTGNAITVTGTEVDGAITNEGALTVGAGTTTSSVINSNTSGSTPVTIQAGNNLTITESGNTITMNAEPYYGQLSMLETTPNVAATTYTAGVPTKVNFATLISNNTPLNLVLPNATTDDISIPVSLLGKYRATYSVCMTPIVAGSIEVSLFKVVGTAAAAEILNTRLKKTVTAGGDQCYTKDIILEFGGAAINKVELRIKSSATQTNMILSTPVLNLQYLSPASP